MFVNYRNHFKGVFQIKEIYTFLSYAVPTYFVDETVKKPFENVQKRFLKTSKSSKFPEHYRRELEKQLGILNAIIFGHGLPLLLQLSKPKSMLALS